ncbi:DUF4340 domain-containing protein [Candidatus Gracilibacteria bacterium]|nr:DUF4340 domain-containing protein [Candidatus Gracilibacteria bacterium]NJM88349.1 DUF4340 domain-containing protein [Hydrococcus sp. RU_2_2]NJP20261.1 DUF4340 domain-containing protein [Hydrococcus sp. CRU_1_1]
MKLQKTTWLLVVIAMLFGGVIYFLEIQKQPQQSEIKADGQTIFNFQKEDIQKLIIKTQKEKLEFEKTNRENQQWQMKQPENVIANDAAISFLLNLLVEGKRDREFKISRDKIQEYGLAKPLATIEVQLKDRNTHQLILGKSNFEDKLLYAQVNPSAQSGEATITLIPKDFQYAIERDLTEWKQQKETPSESKLQKLIVPGNSEIEKQQ